MWDAKELLRASKVAKKKLVRAQIGSLMEKFWVDQILYFRKEFSKLPVGTKEKPLRFGGIRLKKGK